MADLIAELEACPFCGTGERPDLVTNYPGPSTVTFAIECNECGARTAWCTSSALAEKNWNRRTHHATLADMAKRLEALQSLAAAMYQAAGAYDMPVRFLDVLSAAGNGKPITEEQVDALLPCETPDTLQRLEAAERDAAYGRALIEAMNAEYQAAKESRKGGKQEAWITTYTLLRRLKVAADHLTDMGNPITEQDQQLAATQEGEG